MSYVTELHTIELNFQFVKQAGGIGQFNNETTFWENLEVASRLQEM
jgi:hypothetical protein